MQAKKNNVMLDSQNGLIQGVSDNFDANLSTQNGLKQIHSLASVILQHRKVPQEDKREPIPRLKKRELASAKLKEPEMKISKGQKKAKHAQLLCTKSSYSTQDFMQSIHHGG